MDPTGKHGETESLATLWAMAVDPVPGSKASRPVGTGDTSAAARLQGLRRGTPPDQAHGRAAGHLLRTVCPFHSIKSA